MNKNIDIIHCEKSFLQYIGREKLDNLEQIIPPQDMMQLRNVVFAINTGASSLSCFRIRVADGTLNWIAANVEKADGKEELVNMEFSDIQSLKSNGVSARYDAMTGLLNKPTITDYAIKLTMMKPAKRFYFCLMDIDHFKNVNDVFGHMRGDETIIDVAHIIRDCVGKDGLVGRIGGDEFMVVLENVDNKPRVREVLAHIRETVEEKYKQMEDGMHITVSIGCSLYPDYTSDYGELFKLTDKMLYLAKVKGRNRYIIYTPEIHGAVREEAKVTSGTHHAANEKSKLHLMLKLMGSFLHATDIPIRMAIEDILVAYDLDEIFVFLDSVTKNRYGIGRLEKSENEYEIEDREISMEFLTSNTLKPFFDENNTAILNYFDLNKERHGEVMEYMEKNERRFMIIYHITEGKKEGYIVYINKRENSRRLSESDISDLIYFGRMLELTTVDR